MKANKKHLFSILIILLNHAYLPPARAVVTPPLTKCHIEIDDPHLSNNLFITKGIRAVKVNARSTCNKPMRNLVLTVEIYKVGFFRDVKVKTNYVNSIYIAPNRGFKNEITYAECLSHTESRYYGVAFAEADVEGRHLKTLHVTSERTKKIKCGT